MPDLLFPGTTASMMQAVGLGVFAGAVVSLQTAFWPMGENPNGNIVGVMQLNTGQIGNVKKTGRSKVTFELFDMTYILNRPIPPYQIQSSCRHTLFDPGCTLLASNWQTTYTIDTSSTNLWLNFNIPARVNGQGYDTGAVILEGGVPYRCISPGTAGSSPPTFNAGRYLHTTDGGAIWQSMANAYPLGYVTFASGQNTGFSSSVKAQTLSTGGLLQFQLSKAMPFTVAGGDTILATAGCDKTMTTCNLYENLIHIGAMPFCPNPEQAL
jgi:hypothetical protein